MIRYPNDATRRRETTAEASGIAEEPGIAEESGTAGEPGIAEESGTAGEPGIAGESAAEATQAAETELGTGPSRLAAATAAERLAVPAVDSAADRPRPVARGDLPVWDHAEAEAVAEAAAAAGGVRAE